MEEVVGIVVRFLAGIAMVVFEAAIEAVLYVVWELFPRRGESVREWWRAKSRWQMVRWFLLAAAVLVSIAVLLMLLFASITWFAR